MRLYSQRTFPPRVVWPGAVVLIAAIILLVFSNSAFAVVVNTVTINQAATQDDPTAASPIHFTAVFEHAVEDFDDPTDVTLSGTAGPTTIAITDSGDHKTYDVAVSGMTASGTVTATIPSAVAWMIGFYGNPGHANAASTSTDNTVTYDGSPANVTINQAVGQADPAFKSPVRFTVVFDKPVTGFASGDISISGTAGATTDIVSDSGDHKTFTVEVSGMTQSGTVVAEVNAGVCVNGAGIGNYASTSTDNQVTWNMKPLNVMLMPSSGNLLTDKGFVLRAQYTDPDGNADIRRCFTLISDGTRSWANAVYLQYDCATDKMYLRNDGDTEWSPPCTPGTAMIAENSQAKLLAQDCKVTRDGNYVTIDWAVELKSATMAGRNLWGWSFVWDNTGAYDGWIKSGEYTSALQLAAVDVSPKDGALPIGVDQVFTVKFFDGASVDDINRVYFLLNSSIVQNDAISLCYQRTTNKVYLKNDAGTSWGLGYAPGTPIILENSQCYVNVGAMNSSRSRSVRGPGNLLTLSFVVQLKPSMAGKLLNAWTYALNNALKMDDWKVLGTYYAQLPPTAVSFSPTATVQTGTASVVSGAWADGNGYENLERCYLLLTPTMGNVRYVLGTAQANACYVRYNAYENKIYLKNDANTSWGTGYAPGDSATLSNSQVSIDVSASTVEHPNANTTKLNLMLTPSWAAATTLGGWLQARDEGGALSDWTPMTPQAPNTPLTVVP